MPNPNKEGTENAHAVPAGIYRGSPKQYKTVLYKSFQTHYTFFFTDETLGPELYGFDERFGERGSVLVFASSRFGAINSHAV